MKISRNNLQLQNLSFQGHKKALDKKGEVEHSFYYLYDSSRYKCELELYELVEDKNHNFSVGKNFETVPMDSNKVALKLDSTKTNFAYRFKLTENGTDKVSYAFDNGTVIGLFNNDKNNKYNVVLGNRAIVNKNGPMQLIMPDGYSADKLNEAIKQNALNVLTRTHANKLGGNFDGLMERLDSIADEGVSRIVGTPFTKDTVSSHKYWTENAYRVAPDLGGEAGFEKLQVELFKRGINWVADAALVNEGLQGVHVSEMLRHGDESYAKDMFNVVGKPELGVLPSESDYVRLKFINSPFLVSDDGNYNAKNPEYNPKKPTYIQFYDSRLATPAQLKSGKTFYEYDNKVASHMFEITKHYDAVYPYSFEVNPSDLTYSVNRVKTNDGKVDLGNLDTIKQICNLPEFSIVSKAPSGGVEFWDGNVDIPKLKFYTDEPDMAKKKASYAVRDYALNSGRYWTQKTANIQLSYLSQYLSENLQKSADKVQAYDKLIADGVKAKAIPQSALKIEKEVIENVLNNNYHSRLLDDADMSVVTFSNEYSLSDYIMKKSMDLPIETIPVDNNLLGILTSPYIAKKPNDEDEIGISKFDLAQIQDDNQSKAGDEFYAKLSSKMEDILGSISGLSEDENVSDYGKFVISEIAPDLTKYLFLRSIELGANENGNNLDINVQVDKNGNFDFSKVEEKDITMQALGIQYGSKTLEEEAEIVMDVLNSGLENISKEEINYLKDAISNRFKNRSLEDFKIAEMIMDRTESGLGWRIDATKDIVSIVDVRCDDSKMQNSWDQVIDFWKQYNQAVLQENPHAYTTAEITDLDQLFPGNPDETLKYTCDAEAERKFLEQTGITSVANYNYFFSKLPALFAPVLTEGDEPWQSNKGETFELLDKLDSGWGTKRNPGFLFQSPADGVKNSYTFVDNHDKPRILHLLATDQKIVNSKPTDDVVVNAAKKILGDSKMPKDLETLEPLAIASGHRLLEAFKANGCDTDEVKNALSKLVLGKKTNPTDKTKDITFDAIDFGTKPFEILIAEVFDEAELNGAKIEDRAKKEAEILQSILEPAMDRMKSIYKLMVALPGSPTDFAGDKVASTGYEAKAKNYYQQNRNPIHWEWLSTDSMNNYEFVHKYNKQMQEISKLRERPELSALNDGDTITSNLGDIGVQAFVRYNGDSTVLVLSDNSGANSNLDKEMNRSAREVDLTDLFKENVGNSLFISDERVVDPVLNSKRGVKHGITDGTVFKNVREEDVYEYVVRTKPVVEETVVGFEMDENGEFKRDKDGNKIRILKHDNVNRSVLVRMKDGKEDSKIDFDSKDFNTLILYATGEVRK